MVCIEGGPSVLGVRVLVLHEDIPSQRVNWGWDFSISELGGTLDILLRNPVPSPCQWQN